MFFMLQITKNEDVFGITETSNYSNYLDLKYKFNSLKINKNIYNNLDLTNYNFIRRDQYGGKYELSDYLKNPRNLLSKSKNLIFNKKSQMFFFS